MDSYFSHHDNTLFHRTEPCTDYLTTTRVKMLEYSLLVQTLISVALHQMKGVRFSSDEDFSRTWDNICSVTSKLWFRDCCLRMKRYISCNANNFEKKYLRKLYYCTVYFEFFSFITINSIRLILSKFHYILINFFSIFFFCLT